MSKKDKTKKAIERVIEDTQLLIPLINFRKDILERNCLVIKDPTSIEDEYIKFRYYLSKNNTTVITDVLGHAITIAARNTDVCDLSAFPLRDIADDTEIYGNIRTIILPATCTYIPKYLLESERLQIKYAGFELPAYFKDYKDRIEMVTNPFIRIGTKIDENTAKVNLSIIGNTTYKPELVDKWVSIAKLKRIDPEVYIAQNMDVLEGYFGYGTFYKHLEYEFTEVELNLLISKSISCYDYTASEFFRKDLKYSELNEVFE